MLQDKLLKHQAYNTIREKIIKCEYSPNTLLNEDMLVNAINASKTPIRDALNRLEQEGLVKILPQKGAFVSEISINEINKVFETRMIIEPYSVLKYGYRIKREVYLDYYNLFSQSIENIGINNMYDIDDKFHREFILATKNSYLIQIYEYTYSQNRRFRTISGTKKNLRLLDTQIEHLDIVKTCLDKNWSKASDAMKHHLCCSKEASFEVLFNNRDWN